MNHRHGPKDVATDDVESLLVPVGDKVARAGAATAKLTKMITAAMRSPRNERFMM